MYKYIHFTLFINHQYIITDIFILYHSAAIKYTFPSTKFPLPLKVLYPALDPYYNI